MRKKKLGVVAPASERLGLPTIMDRQLAQKYGARYVHLAAFAIDVDRVRDEVETEAQDPRWPFGFEVFLTEACLIEELELETDQVLLAEICVAVMTRSTEEEGQIFGAQIPFAVYDGISRGVFPYDMRRLFKAWRSEPRELLQGLAALWAHAAVERSRLAKGCLAVDLHPALAPPTVERLRAWSR